MRPLWLVLVWALGCDAAAPSAPSALRSTLDDLARFGEKHVGSDPGTHAGDYVRTRFGQAHLGDVHFETFQFPRHDLAAATVTFELDGQPASIPFDVFEGSGAGHVPAADLVWVNYAEDDDLAGVDLSGKIALVDRKQSFHRSSQFRNVIAKGALAMVYVSAAVDNLRQVGSVRLGWDPVGAIPAVTLGADDGARLEATLRDGGRVRAALDVTVQATPSSGRNVIGRVVGSDPSGQFVVGAHYDSWFVGSSDNGGGVAALLELAARWAARPRPRYTIVFVSYDGEEVALYGGYDYLRRHRVETPEPILAVINFEVPSALGASQLGLARSNHAPLDRALLDADLNQLYPLYGGLEVVPIVFGGVIPTDIQGIYRSGVPTASTAVDAPYYHTVEDTPDKVDVDMLAQAVDAFDKALLEMMGDEPAAFAGLDQQLWSADVTSATAAGTFDVTVDVRDAFGAAQASAPVDAALLVDDFFVAGNAHATADAAGRATLSFPAAATAMGAGRRFLHVTSGPTYPLVERVIALP